MQKDPSEWSDEEMEAWIHETVQPHTGATYRAKARIWRQTAMGLAETDYWAQQAAWRISRTLDAKAEAGGEWE